MNLVAADVITGKTGLNFESAPPEKKAKILEKFANGFLSALFITRLNNK